MRVYFDLELRQRPCGWAEDNCAVVSEVESGLVTWAKKVVGVLLV